MGRKNNLDKFHDVLFKDFDEMEHLLPVEQQQLKRYRAAFNLSLENPSTTDVKIRDFLMSEFGISEAQAYRDIGNIRVLLGNMQNSGKEWIRYLVNETLKEAIDKCRTAKKWKEVILAAATLAKYNMLDKETAEQLPWEEIKPQDIEPTSDPTGIIRVKKLENKEAVIQKLKDKYLNDIEEIGYEDIKEDGN